MPVASADHFRTFARYNRWANRRLYAACDTLGDAERRAERGAFFGSIHNTLNHILLGDTIWLGRIAGAPPYAGPLDAVLFEDFSALRDARAAKDADIIALVDAMADTDLAADLTYSTTSGAVHTTPLRWVLSHIFNHQTHHRGQVHDMLNQAGVAPPELDLIYYLRETMAG